MHRSNNNEHDGRDAWTLHFARVGHAGRVREQTGGMTRASVNRIEKLKFRLWNSPAVVPA